MKQLVGVALVTLAQPENDGRATEVLCQQQGLMTTMTRSDLEEAPCSTGSLSDDDFVLEGSDRLQQIPWSTRDEVSWTG